MRYKSQLHTEYSRWPTCGCSVVKGYAATCGFAFDMTLSSVDFPVIVVIVVVHA
jgi:hypothetical protein